jgi:hypothetical protein
MTARFGGEFAAHEEASHSEEEYARGDGGTNAGQGTGRRLNETRTIGS